MNKQALYCDFVAKDKFTGLDGLRFTLMCVVEEDQTPQQVVNRLVEVGFIGPETVKQLQVIAREGNTLMTKDLQGNVLHSSQLSTADFLPE
jgi:hypothetical protein